MINLFLPAPKTRRQPFFFVTRDDVAVAVATSTILLRQSDAGPICSGDRTRGGAQRSSGAAVALALGCTVAHRAHQGAAPPHLRSHEEMRRGARPSQRRPLSSLPAWPPRSGLLQTSTRNSAPGYPLSPHWTPRRSIRHYG